MAIVRVRLLPYALPLRDTWPSAEGAISERRGFLLALEEEAGRVGLGDAAPWPGFGLETVASAGAALRKAAGRLVGLPSDRYARAIEDLPRLAPVVAAPTARHAIDLALHDLLAQHAGVPIARFLGGDGTLAAVPANGAIPRLDPARCAERARALVAAGAGTLKLKVGGVPLAEDLARVSAVRHAAGPGVRIRLDANQSWSYAEAVAALRALRDLDLEYVEQPLPAPMIDGMAKLRAEVGVPLAADESVRDLETARRLLDRGAADILVVKPMALGGLHAARAVAKLARDRRAGVVVTSLLESAVGRTGAVHCAASLGPTARAHGVATADVLARDVGAGPPLSGGVVPVPDGPGLGVAIDPALWLEALVAEPGAPAGSP